MEEKDIFQIQYSHFYILTAVIAFIVLHLVLYSIYNAATLQIIYGKELKKKKKIQLLHKLL